MFKMAPRSPGPAPALCASGEICGSLFLARSPRCLGPSGRVRRGRRLAARHESTSGAAKAAPPARRRAEKYKHDLGSTQPPSVLQTSCHGQDPVPSYLSPQARTRHGQRKGGGPRPPVTSKDRVCSSSERHRDPERVD
ncbi:hypothetical protein NDU88_006613 [Pleurodeles waltl]|uniref:Uncharacterized protein n=1 Tax=Pleurodeles waltl TaxID=8319 RepID=A0AAV7NQU6_PLEWA|nr:hypothetical protein NDU88_006613 [Pleurodeles waltl]